MNRVGTLAKIKLKRPEAQKLVSDLDSVIKAYNISDKQLTLVQTRVEDITEEEKEEKIRILATVFFDLIDQGYSIEDLRR